MAIPIAALTGGMEVAMFMMKAVKQAQSGEISNEDYMKIYATMSNNLQIASGELIDSIDVKIAELKALED